MYVCSTFQPVWQYLLRKLISKSQDTISTLETSGGYRIKEHSASVPSLVVYVGLDTCCA